jgi:hypothetical protein
MNPNKILHDAIILWTGDNGLRFNEGDRFVGVFFKEKGLVSIFFESDISSEKVRIGYPHIHMRRPDGDGLFPLDSMELTQIPMGMIPEGIPVYDEYFVLITKNEI